MATNFVRSTAVVGGNATSTSMSNLTPEPGDDLILLLITFTADAALESVASSVGAEVVADVPFAIIPASDNMAFGVYRVHGASAVSQTINAIFAATTAYKAWLIEASSVAALDPNAIANVLTGGGTTIETNDLTPSENGALLLAFGGSNHFVSSQSGWSGGFSNLSPFIGGPTALAGYLEQATAAETSTSNTIGTSVNPWAALIVSYVPVNDTTDAIAAAATDVTSASGALSRATALTGTALVAAYDEWIQVQSELRGDPQYPSPWTPEELHVFLTFPELDTRFGFSAPWHSIIGATTGGYVNLLSIFPLTGPTNGGALIFYDCVSEALATSGNQVLSIPASQIVAGTPINLVSPSNPNGYGKVSSVKLGKPDPKLLQEIEALVSSAR